MVAQKASYSQITEEGGDFRDYEQKRKYKKREFVHKIKKRGGISKVKCILIFQG